MNKKTIIHIGLHKTASTFLQTIVFPKSNVYTYLTRPYTQHNFAWNKFQYADDSLFDYSELKEELRKIGSNKLLISDESFSGKPTAFGYINRTLIAQRLRNIFPNAQIVLFIRGQQQILLSHYNMWVKGFNSGYRNIDDFIWHPSKNYTYNNYIENAPAGLNTLYWNSNKFYLHVDCFKYYELVSLYKSLFQKVDVFLYEDLISNKRQVLNRLENILEERIIIPKSDLIIKVNKSLTQNELQKKISDNKIGVLTKNRYFKKILGLIRNFYENGNKSYLNPEEYIDKITKHVYEKNNKRLIQDYPEIGIQTYPEAYKAITKE